MRNEASTPREIDIAESGTNGRLGSMAEGVIGSEILKIASDIRSLVSEGKAICNLTVGDFSPTEFRPPKLLQTEIKQAIDKGETHYPPSDGMLVLRQAIQKFYKNFLGLDYPLESVLVHGGSRPGIYGAYRTLVDPGDAVVYPVPSWNNNHYCHLVRAEARPVVCRPEDAFLPTHELLNDAVRSARMVALCSPGNPTGTAFTRNGLEEICDLILEENLRRRSEERPLYLLYDQVYWMLTFGHTEHHNPVSLRPELAKYTILIDGISKAFASTGIRVGWTVGPPDIIRQGAAILAHVGAWAPRAEQVATAALLHHEDAIREYNSEIKRGVLTRLDALHKGISQLCSEGFPVSSIQPMGAIYLSARFGLNGKRTRSGRMLPTNEDIRAYLLAEAQVGVVPFQAFGSTEETGWFRLSVGAVSLQDIHAMFPRLRKALQEIVD